MSAAPAPLVRCRSPTTVDTGGFFEAAARGELAHPDVQRLRRRAARAASPTATAAAAGTAAGRPSPAPARLYSWTVVAHQVHPAFPVPYTVVLVELDDHPEARLVGQLPGRPELVAGQPMEVWFEPLSDDVVLPQWRPAPLTPD